MSQPILPEFYLPVQPQQGHSIFNDKVDEFLNKASSVAKDILGPDAPQGGVAHVPAAPTQIGKVKTTHFHFGNTYNGIFMSGGNTYVTHNHNNNNKKKEDEVNPVIRVLVGIAAAVVGGIAMYTIGQTINHIRDASDELKDVKTFNKDLKKYDIKYTGNKHIESLKKVTSAQQAVFSRIRTNAIWKLALTISLAAAAAFGLAGALVGSAPLIIAGVGVGALVAAGMLLKWGLDSTNKRHVKDAKEIQDTVKELKAETQPIWHQHVVQQQQPVIIPPMLPIKV